MLAVLLLAALDPPELLTFASAVLGVVGLLGAAAAVLRAAHVKASLDLLRGEVGDLTAALARREGENTQLKEESSRQQQQITMLQEMVTSRAAVDQLIGALKSLERTVLLAVGRSQA